MVQALVHRHAAILTKTCTENGAWWRTILAKMRIGDIASRRFLARHQPSQFLDARTRLTSRTLTAMAVQSMARTPGARLGARLALAGTRNGATSTPSRVAKTRRRPLAVRVVEARSTPASQQEHPLEDLAQHGMVVLAECLGLKETGKIVRVLVATLTWILTANGALWTIGSAKNPIGAIASQKVQIFLHGSSKWAVAPIRLAGKILTGTIAMTTGKTIGATATEATRQDGTKSGERLQTLQVGRDTKQRTKLAVLAGVAKKEHSRPLASRALL